MKLAKVLMGMTVIAALSFAGCKPKDEDIKAKVEAAVKADPMFNGAMVDVKDGVVTLSGELKDDACKAACEKAIAAIKDVKNVVNNATVTPAPAPAPAPASVTAAVTDPKLQDAVKAIIKDIPGISIEGFSDKGVILKGDISKANNRKLKQALAAAKILYDTASKLIIK